MLFMKRCKRYLMVKLRATVSKILGVSIPFSSNAHSEIYLGHIARLVGRRKLSQWNAVCKLFLTRSLFAAECPRFVVM